MFGLTIKSLRNRKFTTILTVASIALSVTLLLGVERIRKETRASFSNTISGTDLIDWKDGAPVPGQWHDHSHMRFRIDEK